MTSITKLVLLCLFSISVHSVSAQRLYLTPSVGIKSDISSSTRRYENLDQSYFKHYSPRFSFTGLSPLVLGLGLEYKWNDHLIGVGVYYGDQANSTIIAKYDIKIDDPYMNNIGRMIQSEYAGWPVFKVPLTYKYPILQKANPEGKKLWSVNLNTGMNLLFLKIKNEPMLRNPLSWGAHVTTLGDTVEYVGYEGHMKRSFSVSFNLGLDFELYLKSKRRVSMQLYYEQGTFNISQAMFLVYKNSEDFYWFGVNSTSRGSSVHFKLCFPIAILK